MKLPYKPRFLIFNFIRSKYIYFFIKHLYPEHVIFTVTTWKRISFYAILFINQSSRHKVDSRFSLSIPPTTRHYGLNFTLNLNLERGAVRHAHAHALTCPQGMCMCGPSPVQPPTSNVQRLTSNPPTPPPSPSPGG